MATPKQIRDDTRDAIAALPAVITRGITPRSTWVPDRQRTDEAAEIIVCASSREVELVGRGVRGDSVRIEVGICEGLGADPEATGDAGQVLADAIIDGLLSHRLAGSSNAVCVSAEHLILTAPDHWRELRQFTGVVRLAFR